MSLLLFSLASTRADWLIEYDIGGGSRPCGIVANGTIWFTTTGERRSVIGSIVPSTGRITKYYLSNQSDLWDLICGPENLRIEDDSNSSFIWFVQRAGNKIGRLNPRTGEASTWAVPTPGSTPLGIAIHRYQNSPIFNNTLFFTEYDANRIGALRLIGGQWTFKEFSIPTANSRPVDITVDNEGYVWFTEFAADRIGRLNSTDGTFVEYLVLEGSRPWGIAVDSKGFIWFTMSEARRIAKLDPRSGLCESYEVPTARSKPRHIKVDSWGSVWFTEYDAGKIMKYLPNNTAFIELSLSPDCGPDEIALGYPGEVWIAESRSIKIARILPSISATVSTASKTSGVETASVTTFTTPTTMSRLTGLTFTSSALTTVTTTVAATVMSTTTATATATTSTTSTTTVTPPTMTTTLTVTTTPARACMIASAAHESELAAPVQLLRNFRDRHASSTFAGSQFLKAFNSFYYSFSPMIARSLADSGLLRESVKILLYPLVGTLHLSSTIHAALAYCPEVAITISGLVASFLIGLIYLGPLVIIAMYLKRYLPQ